MFNSALFHRLEYQHSVPDAQIGQFLPGPLPLCQKITDTALITPSHWQHFAGSTG